MWWANFDHKKYTLKQTFLVLLILSLSFFSVDGKGQLILEGLFGFFKSPKKQAKNFLVVFLGRIEENKISFWDYVTFNNNVNGKDWLYFRK